MFDDWSYEISKAGGHGGTLVLAPTGSVVRSFGFGLTDPRAVEIILPAGIAILAVHPLSPYTEFRALQNDRQLGFAADWAAIQDGPAIVVGDFNATPWSYPFRRLMASTDLIDSARGFGLELSYPADSNLLLRISIDHLLHSPDFVVVDRQLGPAMGSDHFPLIVDLAVRVPS
jgi:endonuclease/exonuclease/phosphatase (EEP) superfamily protein YafD